MASPPNFDNMRKNFIPPSNNTTIPIQKNKSITNNSINNNIMEQMISYDKDSTHHLIKQLNNEYNDQLHINKILSQENSFNLHQVLTSRGDIFKLRFFGLNN